MRTEAIEGSESGDRTRLTEGPRVGPYRLIQQIGEGGMGVVHLALDPHGRAVALKLLRPHIAHDKDARSRLAREVDVLGRIRDPRVAAVIDADLDGERPYLVTRYVPGRSNVATVFAAMSPANTVCTAFPSGSSSDAYSWGIAGSSFQIFDSGIVTYSANAPSLSTPMIFTCWHMCASPVRHW